MGEIDDAAALEHDHQPDGEADDVATLVGQLGDLGQHDKGVFRYRPLESAPNELPHLTLANTASAMLTLILGFNPINMRSTPRTAANFLRALIDRKAALELDELVVEGRPVSTTLREFEDHRRVEWRNLAVRALGIGPDDEVITVPFTWISSAEVIGLVGAKPVFVDVLEDTDLMDPAALEAAVHASTDAVIAGQAAAGIDIGNDGEQGRESFFTYVRHRMSGFGGASQRPAFQGAWRSATSTTTSQSDSYDRSAQAASRSTRRTHVLSQVLRSPVPRIFTLASLRPMTLRSRSESGVTSAPSSKRDSSSCTFTGAYSTRKRFLSRSRMIRRFDVGANPDAFSASSSLRTSGLLYSSPARDCFATPSTSSTSASLAKAPVTQLQQYLTFKVLDGAAPLLSEPFEKASFEFREKTLQGTETQRARWKRGVSAVEAALGEAVREEDRERHQLRRLVRRVPEHDPLVARTLIARQRGGRGHPLVDRACHPHRRRRPVPYRDHAARSRAGAADEQEQLRKAAGQS